MTQGNMDLKVAPGSTGYSANHWGSLRPCFGGLIQFPQTLVWKNTLEMAVFTLILGFRPKLRSQNGPENVQNGPGYQVWMSTGGLEAISGHFINFKVSAFNFLKTTIWKRYGPHPIVSPILTLWYAFYNTRKCPLCGHCLAPTEGLCAWVHPGSTFGVNPWGQGVIPRRFKQKKIFT